MATLGPTLVLIGLFAGLLAFALCLWSLRIARGAERLVPRPGRMIDVPGGALHVVEAGAKDKPPVVLIHGLSGQLQHYTYAMTDLLTGDHHVIALDRPGCGYSTRETDDLAALAEQARMIWSALDTLGVERPVLCGHSLGGAVVLAMALERPDDVAGLALLTPLTHPVRKPHPAFAGLAVRSRLFRRLLAYTVAVPLAQRQARATLDAVFAPEPWPNDFVVRAGGALGLRPKGYVAASGDFMASGDDMVGLAARYGEITAPGAVLLAEDDALLSPGEQGGPMAAHGFSVETLKGRGHMLPITAPEACVACIRSVAAKAESAQGARA
ncbi:MAG: alpha/beta hydrolase [Pseudomonadota bacterium]